VLALEFPPINEILRWQDVFPSFNKVAAISVLAALIASVIFIIAGQCRRVKGAARNSQLCRSDR
jgi:uncharacterized membrane protein